MPREGGGLRSLEVEADAAPPSVREATAEFREESKLQKITSRPLPSLWSDSTSRTTRGGKSVIYANASLSHQWPERSALPPISPTGWRKRVPLCLLKSFLGHPLCAINQGESRKEQGVSQTLYGEQFLLKVINHLFERKNKTYQEDFRGLLFIYW